MILDKLLKSCFLYASVNSSSAHSPLANPRALEFLETNGKFTGLRVKEASKCPTPVIVVFRRSIVHKCKYSIGSDERRQYSQAKFSAENHDI